MVLHGTLATFKNVAHQRDVRRVSLESRVKLSDNLNECSNACVRDQVRHVVRLAVLMLVNLAEEYEVDGEAPNEQEHQSQDVAPIVLRPILLELVQATFDDLLFLFQLLLFLILFLILFIFLKAKYADSLFEVPVTCIEHSTEYELEDVNGQHDEEHG